MANQRTWSQPLRQFPLEAVSLDHLGPVPNDNPGPGRSQAQTGAAQGLDFREVIDDLLF